MARGLDYWLDGSPDGLMNLATRLCFHFGPEAS